MIGQRSDLRHLSLVAVRQPRDKFVYVTGEVGDGRCHVLTAFSRMALGVLGGVPRASKGKRAALRQFLILGASWRLPSVFWREGTG